MNNTNDIPRSTYDQSEILSDIGFFKTLFKLWEKGRQHCIQAIVTDGQGSDGLYEVQPLPNSMKQLKNRKEGVARPKIRVWPLLFRHGGYRIEAYPVVGDTGYVIACDRDGSPAIAANGSENPADNEGPKDIEVFDSCKYEYGFFIPSSWVKPDALLFDPSKNPERAKFVKDMREKMVIGNDLDWDDENSAYISIDRKGNINIHCKKVLVSGDLDVEGYINGAKFEDATCVVGYDEDNQVLKTKKAKVLMKGIEDGEDIPLKSGGKGISDIIFDMDIEKNGTSYKYTIKEGAIQIGGITHFVAGDFVIEDSRDDIYIYGSVKLSDGTVYFERTVDRDDITDMQYDMEYFTFPLYHVKNGKIVLDYRVMIGCGTWEEGPL